MSACSIASILASSKHPERPPEGQRRLALFCQSWHMLCPRLAEGVHALSVFPELGRSNLTCASSNNSLSLESPQASSLRGCNGAYQDTMVMTLFDKQCSACCCTKEDRVLTGKDLTALLFEHVPAFDRKFNRCAIALVCSLSSYVEVVRHLCQLLYRINFCSTDPSGIRAPRLHRSSVPHIIGQPT